MTLIAVTASKGSPGATTTAVALAAAAVLRNQSGTCVELDPTGGTLAVDAQLAADQGLLTLAASGRRGVDAALVERHLQTMPSGVRALVSPASPDRAPSLVATLSPSLAGALREIDGTVTVDCGRWNGDRQLHPVIRHADIVILLTKPTVSGADQARHRLDSLEDLNGNVRLVCVGDHPYRAVEVADALSLAPERVHTIAPDERTAALLTSGAPIDRWMRRSALLRSVVRIHESITEVPTAEASA